METTVTPLCDRMGWGKGIPEAPGLLTGDLSILGGVSSEVAAHSRRGPPRTRFKA